MSTTRPRANQPALPPHEMAEIPSSIDWSQDRLARAALSACGELASPQLVDLLAEYSPHELFVGLRNSASDGAWVRRAKSLNLDQLVTESLAAGLRFIIPGDAEWPDSFACLQYVQVNDCGGAPVGLWVKGHGSLSDLLDHSISIVGSRASTPYGDAVASDISYDLARTGRTIVSGGAYGIDAAAHRGALRAGGRSVAFLAGGLDRPYPSGNLGLLEHLCSEGLLVSEYPLGQTPQRRSFLVRNRLIAAGAKATIVVEAGARSGARNTVSWALACGRPVLAVPGPVTSPVSVSPHRLIRDGEAVLVSDADDVLAVVSPLSEGPELAVGGQSRLLDSLPASVRAVREVLPSRGGLTVAEVSLACGQSMPQTLAALAQLEEQNLAEMTPAGQWRVKRP